MDSTFVVVNLVGFDGSYEYVLEELFYNANESLGEVIMIFPYMGAKKEHKLSSLIHYIKNQDLVWKTKIHFVLDQKDMLGMSCMNCRDLFDYGINIHTKGDIIAFKCGLNVQCDDLSKNSMTEEELDDMFLKLYYDNKNQKNHFYAFAWDESKIDDRLLRFDERLLLVGPVSNNNLVRFFSYSYDENKLLSYSLENDRKRFDEVVKYIYIDKKEFGSLGPKKVKK